MQPQAKISYDISRLKPVISEQGFKIHMDIYNAHVSNFTNGTGDIPFNKAGEFLHRLYFENIREYRQDNTPLGKVADIILLRYGSIKNFIKTYLETVEKLQGSGWVFMNTAGYLNIIPNNRIVDNIAFVIDFWEHAYLPMFGSDRMAYAKHHFNIINWDEVNQRIQQSKDKKDKKSTITGVQ